MYVFLITGLSPIMAFITPPLGY